MLELSFYPVPDTNTVQFAVPIPVFEKAGITAVRVDTWFDSELPVSETNHELPVIETNFEENQYMSLSFYTGARLYTYVIFHRRKEGIAIFMKDDNINIFLLVNPKNIAKDN